jgi:hypothetical protein
MTSQPPSSECSPYKGMSTAQPHSVRNGNRDEVAVTSASHTDVQASRNQIGSRRRSESASAAYVTAVVTALTTGSLDGNE